MDEHASDTYMQMFTEADGLKVIAGDSERQDVQDLAQALAGSCHEFRLDSEEIMQPLLRSCLNCHYRRMMKRGFTCYKEFPFNEVIGTR